MKVLDFTNPKPLTPEQHALNVIEDIKKNLEWAEKEKYLVKTTINGRVFYSWSTEKPED